MKWGRLFPFKLDLELDVENFIQNSIFKEACGTNSIQIKKDFLRILKDKIHEHMKCNLTQAITKIELLVTLNTMAKGKGLGRNGVVVEVFQRLWLAIGIGYIQMV
jgi:hypothetical protein